MKKLSDKITQNINQKANMIWNIADIITGLYKPHEYGEIILPMTILKRFNDVLEPTKEAVLDKYKEVKDLAVKEGFLYNASGYRFYNVSPFTFKSLLNDPDNIEANFRAYINGFSDNIIDVMTNFNFDKEISKLSKNNKLFYIIQEFNKKESYMGADAISSVDMGYIFEELIRKFSESYNEDAGQHFTSRDIIYLMTDILICEEEDVLSSEGVSKTVYDMTMGTSQMLGCMEERLKELDNKANVLLFGQEINDKTYAIAKADMLIKDGNADNMRLGNTLDDDKFEDFTFDYIISNPPFGRDWKSSKDSVTKEHKKGEYGRFGVGLPAISDSQTLFTLNGIKKLKDTGKMAIIHNGSALFSGDAGSGNSEIRKFIIENDLLEAIIQLPNDSFYNTGISTYIWVISKNKPSHRVGKVQLIDASKMFDKRRKSIGNKRNDISDECREAIVKVFGEFQNKLYEYGEKSVESKIFDNEDFGYYKITVETPQLDENGNVIKKNNKPVVDTDKRDTENIPLKEDIEEYFKREVIPYNPHAWIDKTKTKVGYEIPFTRHFYKYTPPEKSDEIAKRIMDIESELMSSLKSLFDNTSGSSEYENER